MKGIRKKEKSKQLACRSLGVAGKADDGLFYDSKVNVKRKLSLRGAERRGNPMRLLHFLPTGRQAFAMTLWGMST